MKTILFLSVLVIITTPYCYSAAIEDTATDTNTADITTTTDGAAKRNEMDIDIEAAQTINIINENKDCDDSIGLQDIQGEQGPPGGGATYTRWGRTVCPDTNGTELVYKGLVAGTDHARSGGGANYLCITEEPEYLSSTVPHQFNDFSYLTGTKYQLPGFGRLGLVNNLDIACAVCYTSQRTAKLMIPGKISCPASWTEEYEGYLMAERSNHDAHKHNKAFICLDKDGEAFSTSVRNTPAALADLVAAKVGLPCPKYVANRPITCVVCTK